MSIMSSIMILLAKNEQRENSTYTTASGSVLVLLRFGSGGSGWPYFARRSFALSRYCNCITPVKISLT